MPHAQNTEAETGLRSNSNCDADDADDAADNDAIPIVHAIQVRKEFHGGHHNNDPIGGSHSHLDDHTRSAFHSNPPSTTSTGPNLACQDYSSKEPSSVYAMKEGGLTLAEFEQRHPSLHDATDDNDNDNDDDDHDWQDGAHPRTCSGSYHSPNSRQNHARGDYAVEPSSVYGMKEGGLTLAEFECRHPSLHRDMNECGTIIGSRQQDGSQPSTQSSSLFSTSPTPNSIPTAFVDGRRVSGGTFPREMVLPKHGGTVNKSPFTQDESSLTRVQAGSFKDILKSKQCMLWIVGIVLLLGAILGAIVGAVMSRNNKE